MSYAMNVQFNIAQRHDLTVTFVEPASSGALYELASLDGVMNLEPMRSVPARLRFEHRMRQVAITGLTEGAELNRVIGSDLEQILLPPEGLVLSTTLAQILGASRGDTLGMEVMEGGRPVRDVVVADVVDEFMGTSAYMEIGALRRLMREGQVLSGAYIQIDSAGLDELYTRLKATPAAVGVALKDAAIQSFRDTIEQNMGLIVFFNQIFSSIIADWRDLTTRPGYRFPNGAGNWPACAWMGFTRGEISYILLGEFAILTAIAIPLGLAIGYGLAALVVVTVGDTELYRIPLVVGPRTFATAAAGVIVSAIVSCLVVRRRLNRLDLVGVLKTRV